MHAGKVRYRDLTFHPTMMWTIKLEGYRDSLRLLVGVFKGRVVLYGPRTWMYLSEVPSKKARQQVIRSFVENGKVLLEKAAEGPK